MRGHKHSIYNIRDFSISVFLLLTQHVDISILNLMPRGHKMVDLALTITFITLHHIKNRKNNGEGTWMFPPCVFPSFYLKRKYLRVSVSANLPLLFWQKWHGVWFLGWEDPLEKGKTTHSSILAWRIPWTV